MPIADYKGETVSLMVTVTQEIIYEAVFPDMAKALGITQTELAGMLDDAGLPKEPEDQKDRAKLLGILVKEGSIESETIEFDELSA